MRATAVRERRRGVFWPHLACGAFVVLWLDAGVATAWMTALPSVVKLGVLACWLVLATLRSTPFLGTLTVNAWPAAIMLLVTVLYSAEIARWSQYAQGLGYLLIAFALFCFYGREQVRTERNVLMAVMLADLAVTGVRTLIALQADPLLARYLATTEQNRSAVYGSRSFAGLGGYPYAYSLAAILVVLLYFLVRSARKAILLVACLVGGLVLVQMGFTTSIVLVLALGVGFLVRDMIGRPELRFMLYAAAIIGWVSGLYSATLHWMAGLPGVSAAVSTRLLELAGLLLGNSSTGSDIGVRGERWSSSLQLFLSSGVFGLAGRGQMNQDTGAHSDWLDLLASYGLWAGLLALFLFFAWRLARTRVSPIGRESLGRFWVFFLILGLVNTLLFSTIVLTWMFLLPALAEWLGDRTRPRAPATREAVAA